MDIYKEIIKKNEHHKGKVAVSITMNTGKVEKYSYQAIFDKAHHYALRLKKAGIKKGDRVILVGENSPSWHIAFLAIMKIRATAVVIDASLPKEDLEQLIKASDGRSIFASQKVKDKIGSSQPFRVPMFNLSNQGKVFKDSYHVLSPFIEKTIDGDPEVAVIIYSSGTTRVATGIMHTHDAMIKTIRMSAVENQLTSRERILSILPNSHIYGLVSCLLGSMLLGARVHYVESITNENILSAFKYFKPTVFPAVPKVFELFEKQIVQKINSSPKTKKLYERFYPFVLKTRKDYGVKLGKVIFRGVHQGFGGKIRLMPCAGAPIEEKVAEFYYAMGFDLLITYGLTETNIPIIGNRGELVTIDSCGTRYKDVRVKIANQDENGEGEIYVKSPYMMKGYFRNEEATEECFDEEGWFKTGDLAKEDSLHRIRITGRSKENIVLATGKKVAPAHIERQYMEIPDIEELVISGVPVVGDYDEVHAFVVKKAHHLDESRILKAIQERGAKLSQYMKVAKVHFLEEIPKTALHKPKRYLLKKYALDKKDTVIESAECMEENVSEKHEAPSLSEEIKKIIIEATGVDTSLVTEDAKLMSQVGIDSLSAIDIVTTIEKKYGVSIQNLLVEDSSLKQVVDYINTKGVSVVASDETAAKQEIKVSDKNNLHYLIFKSTCLVARCLYKIKVHGIENIPEDKGYILCANHVSNIDYLWVVQALNHEKFNHLCCLAKKELFTGAKVTNLLKDLCGMIPVDRGGMNFEVISVCKEQLEKKWGLLIHPEGTRSTDGTLGEFKKGAATIAKEANVPIIPVYIKGGREIFPPGTKLPRFFDKENKKRYEVEIFYGEAITDLSLSAEALMEKVEEEVKMMIDKNTN